MEAPTRSRNVNPFARWAYAVAGAAVVVAVVAAALAFGPAPGGGPSVALGGGAGSCVEEYSLANLRHRDYAFDGTVTAIEPLGDGFQSRITFTVNHVFSGAIDDVVTLTATGMTGDMVTSAGGPTAHVGDRLLISGDGGFAWPCGFSRTWSSDTAAEWAGALS